MSDSPPYYTAFSSHLQEAVHQTQDLVLAAQAIEARVASLNADANPATVRETVLLIRASAAQMSAMLLGLVALSERLANKSVLRPASEAH